MHLFDVYCSCFMVLSFSLAMCTMARRERRCAGCLADYFEENAWIACSAAVLLWEDQGPLPG